MFSKEHINLLLSVYFFVLGIFALTHMVGPTVTKFIPSVVPRIHYRLHFTQGEGDQVGRAEGGHLGLGDGDYDYETHSIAHPPLLGHRSRT